MIFPECQIQRTLVLLYQSRRNIRHLDGKSRVLKRLEKEENSRGLIDEDPQSEQPSLMGNYQTILYDKDDFKVLLHQRRGNYLIILCPRAEEWVLKTVKQSNLNLSEYNLPDDPKHFHEDVKIKQCAFAKLINDMQLKGNRRLMMLAKFLH